MSESTATLDHVILSWPKHLTDTTEVQNSGLRRSWIQLAKVGTFHSNRYGKFSITKDDLSQMLRNFNEVTPKPPTELPIDYDHLSMDPKKPGDGIAAGWMKQLELREDGEELWAEVEWTEPGAERIEKGEYRFISPSFVKDHTHKDGRKIGTTLLAAAITNHPFLEGMQALTLYNCSAMGDLALVETLTTAAPVHLAELGQRVTFKPDAERTPELTDEERRQTFIVKATAGAGDDQFVRLATVDGREVGWFQASAQLAPAPATENTTMHDTKTTEQKAAAFAARVAELSKGCTLRDAISLATTQDAEGAEAYRLAGIGAEQVEAAPAPASINLSVREGETFDDVAMRYYREHRGQGVTIREAVRAVSLARPDLAATRG